jgi:hypothetical protein
MNLSHELSTTKAPPAPVPFELPMMTYFLLTKHPHGTVAHALDFDLVSVAKTDEEAKKKLRMTIKAHVEFGIQMDITKDILFKAPEEFWAALTPETTLSIGEPIQIDNAHLIRTAYTTKIDETELCSNAA